ncbi:MAG TPA: 7-carboxy-7-deazaguanine synthase QueE [Planctomycetota bacterium]|nr:7-carboxy-7-deazaguanine synthase QueE [Planctomycetota bacterium]
MDEKRLRSLERDHAADLLEVFSSIQGEGPRIGERHLFVRFSHCDLNCAYCDTPKCHQPQATFRLEGWPGSRQFQSHPNPVSAQALIGWVAERLDQVPHRAVSFTGGEPLLHPWMIEALSPRIRSLGVKTLLETDGMLDVAFRRVQSHIDIVSLDWKLPSATGQQIDAEPTRSILRDSCGQETYVKLVFAGQSPDEEILSAVTSIHEIRPEIPLILQPCTPMGSVRVGPSKDAVARVFESASRIHGDVRVIPQVHRMLGVP